MQGQPGAATTADGEDVQIDGKTSSRCRLLDEQSLGELEDMVQFDDLSEGPLLHNLRVRYANDRVYTWVGSILIAVNPFRVLPIYGPDELDAHVKGEGADRAPHVYAIAAAAYPLRRLSRDHGSRRRRGHDPDGSSALASKGIVRCDGPRAGDARPRHDYRRHGRSVEPRLPVGTRA